MKIVAVIPARSGSKRIPNKNIKMYANMPLIYWSISLALQSKFIDKVIVSTDSELIADVAKEYGASVPFLRPSEISGDLATDFEFMKHYIDWLKMNDEEIPDLIVHLRPTYPNRKLSILDDCIKIFMDNIDKYDSLRTVCELDKPAYKMYTVNDNNQLIPLFNTVNDIVEPYNMPAQILPKTYWHNGYIDIVKPIIIINKRSVSGDIIYPYLMSKDDIHDIDTEEDWQQSESMFLSN